jgi:hypothetical protein
VASGVNGKLRRSPSLRDEVQHSLSFMSSVPPGLSSLRLPFGEIVHYPTGRPSIRVLAHEILALGYEVSVFPLAYPDLRPLNPGVWHNSVVIGDIIIFIVTPMAPSVFPDSASAQSGYLSSHNEPDSENIDPDYFDNLLIVAPMAQSSANSASDQSGYLSSHNEQDSDNVDPEFPENGTSKASLNPAAKKIWYDTSRSDGRSGRSDGRLVGRSVGRVGRLVGWSVW